MEKVKIFHLFFLLINEQWVNFDPSRSLVFRKRLVFERFKLWTLKLKNKPQLDFYYLNLKFKERVYFDFIVCCSLNFLVTFRVFPNISNNILSSLLNKYFYKKIKVQHQPTSSSTFLNLINRIL